MSLVKSWRELSILSLFLSFSLCHTQSCPLVHHSWPGTSLLFCPSISHETTECKDFKSSKTFFLFSLAVDFIRPRAPRWRQQMTGCEECECFSIDDRLQAEWRLHPHVGPGCGWRGEWLIMTATPALAHLYEDWGGSQAGTYHQPTSSPFKSHTTMHGSADSCPDSVVMSLIIEFLYSHLETGFFLKVSEAEWKCRPAHPRCLRTEPKKKSLKK